MAPAGAIQTSEVEVNRSINATHTFQCLPGFKPKLGISPYTRCVAFTQENGKWEDIIGECAGVLCPIFTFQSIYLIKAYLRVLSYPEWRKKFFHEKIIFIK